MIDPLSEENKSFVAAAFNIKHLKTGCHIVVLPMRLIGLVAAHWGAFEGEMDKLIGGILKAIGCDDLRWRRYGFTRRK